MPQIRLNTPAQRAKLAPRREPYWARVQTGGYLGYRRLDGEGTWIARWRDTDKQRYRALDLDAPEGAEAFDRAAEAARQWFRDFQAGVTEQTTVKQAADAYVKKLRLEKGNAAAADAEGRIRRCIEPALGDRPLDKLRTADLNDWRDALVPESDDEEAIRKAKDSANRNLTTLKALLNHAWQSGKVASNVAWSRVKPFKNAGRARDVFLSTAQRRRLLDAAKGNFKLLLEAALLTGARYGELRELLVADFDRRRKTLQIRKGKTGARVVPLSDAAARVFATCARNKLPSAHLMTRDDGQFWGHSDQDDLTREAVKAAKLPAGAVFYTLRHTFIATQLQAGLDVLSVAKACGTSVRMIELHYGKFLHDPVREKLNRVAML